MQKTKEVNILLLGETGSGKSTWVNAIANYLKYASLAEAEPHPLTYLIPSHFIIQTHGAEYMKVKVGQSDNESFEEGHAGTQSPQRYTFMYNGRLIRLIDVPGMCDTRGLEKDQENFKLILDELQTVTELHAVCILLPPDSAKLTLAFQYCLNELLMHLHISAAKNVIFCFTRTRTTFYHAGQTLATLRKYLEKFSKYRRDVTILLSEETMYYFDNEAFRLLCAIKNGVHFTEEERNSCVSSWTHSANETVRILDYILTLPPHRTREMLSLNEARRVILSLTKPLADIAQNKEANIRRLEAEKREVKELDASKCNLEAKLRIMQTTLIAKPIDYPRTVCASAKCLRTMTIPGHTRAVDHYEQVCHDHCYLTAKLETYPERELQNCWAITNGRCHQCGCDWNVHVHIRYLQELKDIEVIDATTQRLLDDVKNRKIQKADVMAAYNRQIEELKKGQQTITDACASFGAFLHHNSIVPYNDVMVDYLKQSIMLAEQDALLTGDSQRVSSLKRYLKEYEQELDILKKNVGDNGKCLITSDDIAEIKAKLYRMNAPDCNISQYLTVAERSVDMHRKCEDHPIEVDNVVIGGLKRAVGAAGAQVRAAGRQIKQKLTGW